MGPYSLLGGPRFPMKHHLNQKGHPVIPRLLWGPVLIPDMGVDTFIRAPRTPRNPCLKGFLDATECRHMCAYLGTQPQKAQSFGIALRDLAVKGHP